MADLCNVVVYIFVMGNMISPTCVCLGEVGYHRTES